MRSTNPFGTSKVRRWTSPGSGGVIRSTNPIGRGGFLRPTKPIGSEGSSIHFLLVLHILIKGTKPYDSQNKRLKILWIWQWRVYVVYNGYPLCTLLLNSKIIKHSSHVLSTLSMLICTTGIRYRYYWYQQP